MPPVRPHARNHRARQSSSVAARRHWEEALEHFENKLVKMSTHPDLVTMLLVAVQADNDLDFQDASQQVTPIIAEQKEIGWKLVKFGFISRRWKECQLELGRWTDPNYSHRKAARWTLAVQTALWDYVHSIWNFWNRRVHGTTKEQERLIRTEALRNSARQLLAQHPNVGPNNGHLLRIEQIGSKNQHFLRHWVKRVRSTVVAERVRRSRQNNMREALAAVRTQQRSKSMAPTLVQSSMDRYLRRAPRPTLATIVEGTAVAAEGRHSEPYPQNYLPRIPSQMETRRGSADDN